MTPCAPVQTSLKLVIATSIRKTFRLPFSVRDQQNIRKAAAVGHRRCPCSARTMSVTCNATPQPLDEKVTDDSAGQPSGYRQNVGVCLLHPNGKVFAASVINSSDASYKIFSAKLSVACRRLDDSGQTWQMPQGGIDDGEDPAAAAARELAEETGVRSARIVASHPGWLQYDFPPERRRYLMLFEGEDSEIKLDQPEPEFGEWRWVDLPSMPLHVVPFKQEVYAAVVAHFQPLIAARLVAGRWVD